MSPKNPDTPALCPQMEKLEFLLGTWRAADKYEKTPFNPNGGEGSGRYKTITGPGGFSLLTDYEYEAPHGQASGHHILAWDSKRDCYAGCTVTSSFPGCLAFTGNWDGPTFVLSGEFEARGMKIAFRQIFSDMSENGIILRQYNSLDGAPAQLFGTTILSRETESGPSEVKS
jgi:hypothetical protein